MNIKSTVTGALPLIAGGVAANLTKSLSGKFIQNEKLRAAAPLILGILLASTKGKMKELSNGMIAVGGANLVGSFVPSLAGIEDIDLSGIEYPVLADDISGDYDVINGDNADDIINNNTY